jgi:LPS export ABC transporter protein LptC
MRPPNRFGWPAIALALAVAAGSFALRGYFHSDPGAPVASALAQMDFDATGLDVVRYDEQGTPGFTLSAPRAERFRAEDELKLLDAVFYLADRDAQGGWHGSANTVEVRPDGAPLFLTGDVALEREGEELRIEAPSLSLDPQARRAWGEDTVSVQRPGSKVNAERFDVDMEQSRVQLEGRVSGQFRGAR